MESEFCLDEWDFTVLQDDKIVSIFDNPEIETFAIKTISKSQRNINDEILNLIAIQQEIHKDRDETDRSFNGKSSSQIQYCVKLFEIYEDDDSVHLVMELCEGDSLDRFFTSQKTLHQWHDHRSLQFEQTDSDHDLNEIEEMNEQELNGFNNDERSFKKIMRQLLYSVKCIHDIGIVHRDLKLANIMIKNNKMSPDSQESDKLNSYSKQGQQLFG